MRLAYNLVAAGPPVAPPTTAGANTATPKRTVHVGGLAKAATFGAPYVVANDVICGHLGRTLGLPVSFCFVAAVDGGLHYVALDFNRTGQALPPADVRALVRHDHALPSGVVVFDAWICNADRHTRNLHFDPATGQTHVFDHGGALFGPWAGGVSELQGRRDALNVGEHVVVPHVTDLDGLQHLLARVQALPRLVVEDAVAPAVGAGLTDDEGAFCVDFLVERARRLPELFRRDQGRFTGVAPEAWEKW